MELLRRDPTTWTAAELEGWDHPISREALAIYDLFDLEHAVNSKRRPKPHPGRPFRSDAGGKKHGKARPMPEVVEILNRFGHNIPV